MNNVEIDIGLFQGGTSAFKPLYVGSISASPTACLSRGYGRAGTQNDRLSGAVILSTGTPIPAR